MMTLSDIQADMQAYDDEHATRTFTYAGGTYRTIDGDTFQVTVQVDYSVSTLSGAPQVGRITDIITIRRRQRPVEDRLFRIAPALTHRPERKPSCHHSKIC